MSGDSRIFNRSVSFTLRAAAQAPAFSRTVLSPFRCWMKTGIETVYMETGIVLPPLIQVLWITVVRRRTLPVTSSAGRARRAAAGLFELRRAHPRTVGALPCQLRLEANPSFTSGIRRRAAKDLFQLRRARSRIG